MVQMIVYKKVRLKNGKPFPLFIDKDREFKFGEWMRSEFHPTKGFKPRSINGTDNEEPIGGWHCCYVPKAPHLADELSSGEKRAWMICMAKGEHQNYDRTESQGGTWVLVEWLKPLRLLMPHEVL